jgi:hypothetical protein
MDEQMISKRSEQYTQAVQTGEWIGKCLISLTRVLQYAKIVASPVRTRHA